MRTASTSFGSLKIITVFAELFLGNPGGGYVKTQSLRSIHNLHNIYEEFTGLERVPVRLGTP